MILLRVCCRACATSECALKRMTGSCAMLSALAKQCRACLTLLSGHAGNCFGEAAAYSTLLARGSA